MPPSSTTGSEYHRDLLNAMPHPVMVIDEECRIIDSNAAANGIVGIGPQGLRNRRPGEVLHCIHSHENACGGGEFCRSCHIRLSIQQALKGECPPKQVVQLVVAGGAGMEEMHYAMSAAPFVFENLRLALLILEDLNEIARLQQTLRICSSCKQIHNEEDLWQSLESYLSSHLEIHCTHSLCPECTRKYFPEYVPALRHPPEA